MRYLNRAWPVFLAPFSIALALGAAGPGCGGDDTASGGGGSGAAGGTGGVGTGGQVTGGGGAGGATPDRKVVVLFTSDEHSHLFAFSPELDDFPIANDPSGPLVGGAARRATVIASERKAAADAGKDSILVSAGDNQMGCLPHTAFQSDSIDYRTMKALGYDVTTFGNHEFDFGPKALANAIGAAKGKGGLPPIVSTNIHFSGTSGDAELKQLYSTDVGDAAPVHPYRVLTTKSGIKIGVLGYVGVNASHVAPNKTPVQFSEKGVAAADQGKQSKVLPHLYDDLQPVVDTLRNKEKVDLVVALAHGGIDDSLTQAGREAGDDYNVCENVSGIDFIVSGHAHNPDPKPIVVTNKKSKKSCLALNGSSFGQHLGRVEFTIPAAGGDVTWDKSTQTLIKIDDSVKPDSHEAAAIPPLVESIEKGTYLPGLLSLTTGAPVTNLPGTPGDLYFFPVAQTSFDIVDTHSLLFLSADAMLKAADDWGATNGKATAIGLESAGVIRAQIRKGSTGVISAADAFNVVPLGTSLTRDGSVGYGLIRANVSAVEMKLVFEFALKNYKTNSDYDLGMSGVQITYDATKPALQQVQKIVLDGNHANGFDQFDDADAIVVYDGGVYPHGNGALYAVVTSSYIAQFAGDAGITLFDDLGAPVTNLEDTRLLRADQSEIKQVESFLSYLFLVGKAPGGLPDLYNVGSGSAANRWFCATGC